MRESYRFSLRISNEVTIAEQLFGFVPGRSTADAIFVEDTERKME